MHFPTGRFFDLRTDPLEMQGEKSVHIRWGVKRYSGIPLDELTPEQQKAYDRLGQVLKTQQIVPADSLKIIAPHSQLKTKDSMQLNYQLRPTNTTRSGVIWHSSDPSIASIENLVRLKPIKKAK
ncbi:Ig-like domain-containing protein [Gayadomonas joobiniege]|uniref:Ig-like domain-containing protein n=1 Tax=Gayadomonas joobiniege TaxID=1234606 RepID=UPI000683FA93|nr:hypothetical protein [Gayadomonas joobiniege]